MILRIGVSTLDPSGSSVSRLRRGARPCRMTFRVVGLDCWLGWLNSDHVTLEDSTLSSDWNGIGLWVFAFKNVRGCRMLFG